MDSDPAAQTVIFQLLFLVFLTLVNAFFAGAEMAVVSVNRNKIKRLAGEGSKRASLILTLTENSTGFLSTIQVAITFAGFFSSASAATGISQILASQMSAMGILYSETISVIVVTLILSYFTLVFGELVPKRIALQKAETFSLMCVTPVYMISRIMAPFIKLLSLSTNGFLHLIGMHSETLEEEVSEEEIKSMLETGKETGVFNEIEQEMITSIFSFDDKKAKEVMIPRQEAVSLNLKDFSTETMHRLLKSRHSRIPVYEDSPDHIIGILPVKDCMIYTQEHPGEVPDLKLLLQKPFFVPENQKIDILFQKMQRDKIRMAVLVDEYGGVSGIVTLEDLIEEIVGDLFDEYEVEEPEIVALSDECYRLCGSVSLNELTRELHTPFESRCDTLSGYLIEKLGYIPEPSDLPICIQDGALEYEILKMRDRVISQVLLKHTDDRSPTMERNELV